jgi:hypothetical protein
MRVLRVLGAVAYVGTTALLWYELEQPIEEATSFETFVLLFPVLALVFALLIGRWWFILVPLAILPVTAPSFQSGCGGSGSGATEICTQHIAMLVTFLSFGACVVGMMVYMAGRELLSRRRTAPTA